MLYRVRVELASRESTLDSRLARLEDKLDRVTALQAKVSTVHLLSLDLSTHLGPRATAGRHGGHTGRRATLRQ